MAAATTIAAYAAVAGAVGGTAVAAKGAHDAKNAASNAARVQQGGYDAATTEQARQFDLGRDDTAPFRQVGTAAINQLAQLYGLGPQLQQQQLQDQQGQQMALEQAMSRVGDTDLPVNGRRIVPVGGGRYKVFYGDQEVGDLVPGGSNGRFIGNGNPIPSAAPAQVMQQQAGMPGMGTPGGMPRGGTPDYSAFFNSPDYQFARDEGTRGIERSAAARGGIASGNTLASLARFNSGLATQNYGNYTNRLSALAGIGQTSSENAAAGRYKLGANIGNNLINGAGARASGIQQRGQGLQGLGGDLLGFGGYLSSFRNPNPAGGYGSYPGALTQDQISNIFAPQNPYLPSAP